MKGQISLEAVSMRGQQDRLRPLPEEKSMLRDAKPSWQVTCSLWTVDICLQAGDDSVLPSQAAEGELGCAAVLECLSSQFYTSARAFLQPPPPFLPSPGCVPCSTVVNFPIFSHLTD